jgi:hypothetical protein
MLLTELFNVLTKPINEGGNVFDGKTTDIKLENIKPTINAFFAEMQQVFPNKAEIFQESDQYFSPLGSTYKKKSSGDIDLGIDSPMILDRTMSDESIAQWGIDPKAVAATFELLKKRARTATPEQLRMKAFLLNLVLFINANAPVAYCDEKKVTYGQIFFCYPQIDEQGQNLGIGVQIDWDIGNLEWLKFAYHSTGYPEGSNVKGLHRTQLMLSAFQVAGLSFVHLSGVKDKQTGEMVATNPEEALQVLSERLGFQITRADTEDYYKLHKVLRANMTPQQYDVLINIYFKILDSTRADIPDDLQDEWRARKDQLGLTGKFLPDNSALKVV